MQALSVQCSAYDAPEVDAESLDFLRHMAGLVPGSSVFSTARR
jgi:hypothetical protein